MQRYEGFKKSLEEYLAKKYNNNKSKKWDI
jgi:hypothetical protein